MNEYLVFIFLILVHSIGMYLEIVSLSNENSKVTPFALLLCIITSLSPLYLGFYHPEELSEAAFILFFVEGLSALHGSRDVHFGLFVFTLCTFFAIGMYWCFDY